MKRKVCWVWLTIAALSFSFFALGCDSDDDNETEEEAAEFFLEDYEDPGFRHEGKMAEGEVFGPHHHLLFHLEPSGTHDNDTGEEGHDAVPFAWHQPVTHTFCMEDPKGLGHEMKLLDKNGEVVTSLSGHENCVQVNAKAQQYTLELHHGKKGESGDPDPVFVHPAPNLDHPEILTPPADAKLRGKFKSGSCTNDSSIRCDLVDRGHVSSCPGHYGQPAEGEVIVYSTNSSQQQTSDTGNQDHCSGPTKPALKFNGPCHLLAKTGVEFDDQLVGIIVGPNTGVWLYHDNYFGGANDFYYNTQEFADNDLLLPAGSVSSLYVMTISSDNTYSLISSSSCRGCDLHNADLQDLNTPKTNLKSIDVTGADMHGATFARSDLTDATMTGCNLKNTTFTDATLTNADLSGTHLNGSVLTNTDLKNADLSNAYLNHVEDPSTPAAILTDAYMPNVNLSNAHLQQARLSGVYLYADGQTPTLENADLSGVNFSDAVLYGVNMNSTTLEGVSFNNAVLINADIRGATQNPNGSYGMTSFDHTLLAGTDFTNTNLPYSDLSNAQISRSVHDVDVDVKINRTQIETRTFTCRATVIPGMTGSSICPNRYSVPCDCSQAAENSGCVDNNYWTPPDPPEYIGNNDPNDW